jgi:hypothetical protein
VADGERGVLVELFEDEFLGAGADAAAAGEDGLAARWQAFDEGEKLVAVGLGEGFEIVKEQQRLRGTERVEQESDALVLRGLRDVGPPQLPGEFVEHFQKARDEEVAERALAVVVHLAVLHGDEDDALEEAGWAVVGGADGEGGLAHAARAIDERAPGGGVGIEGLADGGEFGGAAEEGLEAGEVVGGEWGGRKPLENRDAPPTFAQIPANGGKDGERNRQHGGHNKSDERGGECVEGPSTGEQKIAGHR